MPIWDKTSKAPTNYNREQKRNVIATGIGWVRRQTYTDAQGNSRIKDEIIVPIRDLAGPTNMGAPDIVDVWHETSTASIGANVKTFIAFNEPIKSTTTLKLDVKNGGTTVSAIAGTTETGANNTLTFVWKPTIAGTWKVEAQTVANASIAAVDVKSRNAGNEAANLIVSGTVSNNSGTVVAS